MTFAKFPLAQITSLFVLVLAGCTATMKDPLTGKTRPMTTGEQTQKMQSEDEAYRIYFAGKTILTYGFGHGTQVEYFGPDGRNFLWYPGNSIVLPGNWKVAEYALCLKYGPNTYNPVTGSSGSNWECAPAIDSKDRATEFAQGDVFGLQSKLPYVMPKGKFTLQQLKRGSLQ